MYFAKGRIISGFASLSQGERICPSLHAFRVAMLNSYDLIIRENSPQNEYDFFTKSFVSKNI